MAIAAATVSATTAEATRPTRLPPLREEIAIFRGPTAPDGSPTYTLHDPARNRFYRLGWPEFEIISRWHGGTIDSVVDHVNQETTLQIEYEDVDELRRFLSSCDLLRLTTPQGTAYLASKAQRLRTSWGQWLLHNYLFMRIPLLRPDRFLSATYPYVERLYSRGVALTILAIGLLGLYLVARQWDIFLGTFVDMFTVQGAIWFGLTLSFLKVVHELGHAYTAKRFGLRVPTMGLALLVMVPVLYTDVNESWKLTARRDRVAIGIAGVTAELCCAAIAMSAWGFLPNGPVRSAAFMVATSTWITTVLINLSPFMRYDGYYVLSDWLETPNLHIRSFALARWWMREKMLGLGDAPPEDLPLPRQRLLVFFAFLTWVYRFSLFLGIAAIIYHFAVKVLGVAMMAVEIGYFLVRPVVAEFLVWWRRRDEIHLSRRTLATATCAAALAALILVPWRSGIEAPALLKSLQHIDVFVPESGARVAAVKVTDGQSVDKGALMIHLVSPDIDYKIAHTRADLDILEWEMGARGLNPELLAHSKVTEQEYEASLAEYRGLLDEKARLEVTTPIAGKVVDIDDTLAPGMWVKAKSRLASVINPAAVIVEAYVDEADLDRIAVGDTATFYAEADSRIEVRLRVAEIARASTRVLSDPSLASVYGGPITVRTQKQNELIPDRTLYRVTLAPTTEVLPPGRVLRGQVMVRGESASIAGRTWRAFYAIVVREAGP
jgi:putative peptide zinc metalloprotease protein